MVIAKYDYKAKDSLELDISKQERLILLDDTKHWWMVSYMSWDWLVPSEAAIDEQLIFSITILFLFYCSYGAHDYPI